MTSLISLKSHFGFRWTTERCCVILCVLHSTRIVRVFFISQISALCVPALDFLKNAFANCARRLCEFPFELLLLWPGPGGDESPWRAQVRHCCSFSSCFNRFACLRSEREPSPATPSPCPCPCPYPCRAYGCCFCTRPVTRTRHRPATISVTAVFTVVCAATCTGHGHSHRVFAVSATEAPLSGCPLPGVRQ